MMFGILILAASMQAPSSVTCGQASNASAIEQCQGDVDVNAAQAAGKGSPEQDKHWQLAVDHYRKAVDATTNTEAKARLLSLIADLYDKPQLNDLAQLEQTLRELIQYAGTDLKPTFRLARVEEQRGLIDQAENTLLSSHRQQPDETEPYRMLAQFYARRATAMQQVTTAKENAAKNPTPADKPDADGYFHVGSDVTPPRRFGNAVYPPEAKVAGIGGTVVMEISLNEQGLITDARVVRSVPLLDEAALKAVREWRYDPVMVNGKPVPAKMTVTVNFTGP